MSEAAAGNNDTQHGGEQEPLLGRPGDASQEEGKALPWNLFIGTGIIAEAGIIILFAIVWGAVLPQDIRFSAHPLLNSTGIVLILQSMLLLQPTHTPGQKRSGTIYHAIFNGLALGLLMGGLIAIILNKNRIRHAHFDSPHAILGLVTYGLLLIQAIVGFTQYWVPSLYGGVDNAKAVWKYHRMSGYVVFTLTLATVCVATQTDFNKGTLGIKLWSVVVASVLVLVGLLPRIKKQKLGL